MVRDRDRAVQAAQHAMVLHQEQDTCACVRVRTCVRACARTSTHTCGSVHIWVWYVHARARACVHEHVLAGMPAPPPNPHTVDRILCCSHTPAHALPHLAPVRRPNSPCQRRWGQRLAAAGIGRYAGGRCAPPGSAHFPWSANAGKHSTACRWVGRPTGTSLPCQRHACQGCLCHAPRQVPMIAEASCTATDRSWPPAPCPRPRSHGPRPCAPQSAERCAHVGSALPTRHGS